MTRVALVCSEAIRPVRAGIGIRFVELARRLPREGIEVVLVAPGTSGAVSGVEVVPFERGALGRRLAGCDAAVAQGSCADALIDELPDLPVAIDLTDPWLVENLSYAATLGLDPYRNDHASWWHQLSRGDFFLCASEPQRSYYLGFLTAVGRVHPGRYAEDPDLSRLIAVVPSGVPDEPGPHRPVLPPRASGERRLLFGGLYDWYDPWTLLEALARADRPEWRLLLARNPHPESTPQRLLVEVERECRRRGWWGSRVSTFDWLAADRRFDLLRDVDLLVAPHRPTLETELSLRSRFVEAAALARPVVATEGGATSRVLDEAGAGWIVPAGDADALADAIAAALADRIEDRERHARAAQTLRLRFDWERLLAPLLRFCRAPWRDATKEALAIRRRAPSLPVVEASTPAPAPASVGGATSSAGTRPSPRGVAVAVTTCSGLAHLRTLLPALREQADPGVPWKVWLLDNGSRDGTAEWVARQHPEVTLVTSRENLGFGAGNNLLACRADADAIVFLNDDTRPARDWLRALVGALADSPPDVGAVAGQIVDWSSTRLDFANGILVFDGHAFQLDHRRPLDRARIPASGTELPFGCGANLLVRRSAFEEIGGFDGDFFAYMEDVDLGWRLWSAGHRIVFAPEAVVAHRSGGTGVRLAPAVRGALIERNAFLTAYKNYEPSLIEQMLPAILLTILTRAQTLLADAGLDRLDPRAVLSAESLTIPDNAQARARRAIRSFLDRAERKAGVRLPRAGVKLSLHDPRLPAQYHALTLLSGALDEAFEKRRAVQARRRRSDQEYLARFPLHIVPTYPGDEALFASEAFAGCLPAGRTFVRRELRDLGEF